MIHTQRQRFLCLAAICCAAVTAGSTSHADDLFFQLTPQRPNQADQGDRPGGADAERAFELSSGLTVTPRRLLNALTRAQTFIDQELYADAVPLLQAVLDASVDGGYRVAEGESGLLRNLNREAERVVGAMPLEGLAAYELSSGPQAQQLLDDARGDRDVDRLLETSRRFFHTDAGHQATYLLGMLHLDRGRPFEAALCFDRELQAIDVSGRDADALLLHSAIACSLAGFDELAANRLKRLRDRAPEFEFRLRGNVVALPPNDENAITWLRETIGPHAPAERSHAAWALCGGNPARTAASNARVTRGELAWTNLTGFWKVPRDDTPFSNGILNVVRQIDGIEVDYRNSELPPIPQLRPLLVGRKVIARTPTSLRALDLDTGNLLWETARDDVPDRILSGEIEPLPGDRGSILDPLLKDRIFLNAAYGTLSADSNSVFCVERLGMPAQNSIPNMRYIAPSGQLNLHPLSAQTDSELSAYALQDGRRLWTVGGNSRKFPERQLAGGYFLGPPLPLGGQLFGLAEFERRIVLYVLDAADGNLQWSLPLQEFELDVSHDPDRARAGLSPSFDDGVLVCPTGSGVVVAVDVSTRQLIWASRYRILTQGGRANAARQIAMMRLAARRGAIPRTPTVNAHWLDALAMIGGNRVILTPLDADKLLCFDLHDGTLLWEQPRKNRLFVGGIHGDSLIVVGTATVERLSLDNGQLIEMSRISIPPPSGRGLLSADRYDLPLSTGEIASIDLTTDSVDSLITLPPGATPGNLVAAGDNIIMQSPTAISRFASLTNEGN